MYSILGGESKHVDGYNKNSVFNGNTQDLFKYGQSTINNLDKHIVHELHDLDMINFGSSSMSTIIGSNNIFHLNLNVSASVDSRCWWDCWEVEAITSISSIIFYS